jgi:hypothetical protein
MEGSNDEENDVGGRDAADGAPAAGANDRGSQDGSVANAVELIW